MCRNALLAPARNKMTHSPRGNLGSQTCHFRCTPSARPPHLKHRGKHWHTDIALGCAPDLPLECTPRQDHQRRDSSRTATQNTPTHLSETNKQTKKKKTKKNLQCSATSSQASALAPKGGASERAHLDATHTTTESGNKTLAQVGSRRLVTFLDSSALHLCSSSLSTRYR